MRIGLFPMAVLMATAMLGHADASALPAVFRLHGAALNQRLAETWQQAWEDPGVTTGPADSAKRMVVFLDPNCPFCARLWRELRPWRKTVRIHWVPVAFLRPSSVGIAAAILSAPDPAQALDANERAYDFRSHTGGMLPVMGVPGPARAAILRDTALWRTNFGITPTVLFPTRSGVCDMVALPSPVQIAGIVRGMPAGARTSAP